jgi:hypothetical protein
MNEDTDPNKLFRAKLTGEATLRILLSKKPIASSESIAEDNRNKKLGMLRPMTKPDEIVARKLKALNIRIFDLSYRLVDGDYETQYYDTPATVSFPFPADTYTGKVIDPILAALPATPMADHFYQIPKQFMGMRTDDTHWPYYGLIAFRNPEGDCHLNEFPVVADDGTIKLQQNASNVNGELEIGSQWWILLSEYPFGTELPPGWDNTLVTGYGFELFLSSGLTLPTGYKVTSLPDYDATTVSLPPLQPGSTLDVFFPPWLHAHNAGGGMWDLTIIPRETWLDTGTIPSDLTGSLPFNTVLICILEGWGGQRFYVWDEAGLGD